MSEKPFEEFRLEYEARHPASVPVRRMETSPYPRWVSVAAGLMFAFSALLSGVHTVPVVRDGIPLGVLSWLADFAAITSFFSVELAILISTFVLAGGGSLAVRGVLALSTLTALAANLYSVFAAYTATITRAEGDVGMLVVAVLIGIVAPGVAFMSGKMYVNLARANRMLNNNADARLAEERQAWDARVNAVYEQMLEAEERRLQAIRDRQAQESAEDRALRLAAEEQERKRRLDMEERERKVRLDMERKEFEARLEAERIELEERREQVRERSRTQENAKNVPRNSPTGREQPTEAEMKVIEFLRTHPEAATWTRDELAKAAGVAKSTASYGARWMEVRPDLANGHGSNGHG